MEIEMIEFGNLPMFTESERHGMIHDMLSDHICQVVFTKVDGSVRDMKCTLRSDVLSENGVVPNGTSTKPKSNTVIAAYLPEEKVWRSFRVDNVISIANVD